ALGSADVGHILGMGRQAHILPAAVAAISWLYRVMERDRGRGARRAGCRDPGAGWCGESSDHRILGQLAHVASGREHLACRWPADFDGFPLAARSDGARLHAALRHTVDNTYTHRNSGAARALFAAG